MSDPGEGNMETVALQVQGFGSASSPPVEPVQPVKGIYVLKAGDTPGSVSLDLYGVGSKAVDLVRANPDCGWAPGDKITLV